jgi:hypothetical protein
MIKTVRRIIVVLMVLLICQVAQNGLNILNGTALIIDAIVVIVLSVLELRRK